MFELVVVTVDVISVDCTLYEWLLKGSHYGCKCQLSHSCLTALFLYVSSSHLLITFIIFTHIEKKKVFIMISVRPAGGVSGMSKTDSLIPLLMTCTIFHDHSNGKFMKSLCSYSVWLELSMIV